VDLLSVFAVVGRDAASILRDRTSMKPNFGGLRRATGEAHMFVPSDLVAHSCNPHGQDRTPKGGQMCLKVLCRTIQSNYLAAHGHFPSIFMSIGAAIS
jgi:hypothetical protein